MRRPVQPAAPNDSRVEGARRGAWLVCHATVFVASAAVMVLELVAGRIVSRHLGASIYTWTSVIGVILGGLAAGNWAGGRLADRFAPRPTLGVLFLLGSATSVAIVVADALVGRASVLWGLPWPARVASHVALVFFLPAALLGTIGPVVARAALAAGRRTGQTLGSIYAWGVLGSLSGTFLTGYVLIERMGTSAIVWAVGGVLALAGILHLPRSAASWGAGAALVAAFGLAQAQAPLAVALGERLALRERADPTVVYRAESRYSRVEVREAPGTDLRTLYLDKLVHSQISMGDPLRAHYGYIARFAELTRAYAAPGARLDTLTIGGGGYVFPRWLEATWPGGRTEVVEIDEAVTRAAREAFGLGADSAILTHQADGRAFVNATAAARRRDPALPGYDFVYLDAVNDFAVPYQLTTVEFFANVRALLTPGGAVLVNSIDLLASGRFVGALAGTLAEVFPHVSVYTLDDAARMRGDSRLTFVLVASDRPPPAQAPSIARLPDAVVAGYRQRSGVRALTDAFAPVEQLAAPIVRAAAREIGAQDALAQALARERRGDREGSLRSCRRALELDPTLAEAHYTLAGGLHAAGRVGEAIEHWRRAVSSKPDYADAYFNLGAALYGRGDLDAAALALAEAMRLAPRMAAARSAAGVVREARGDLDGAAALYEQALALDPASIEARRDLERVRARLALAAAAPAAAAEAGPSSRAIASVPVQRSRMARAWNTRPPPRPSSVTGCCCSSGSVSRSTCRSSRCATCGTPTSRRSPRSRRRCTRAGTGSRRAAWAGSGSTTRRCSTGPAPRRRTCSAGSPSSRCACRTRSPRWRSQRSCAPRGRAGSASARACGPGSRS